MNNIFPHLSVGCVFLAMILQQKGQILDMVDRGMKVNESTIRTIQKNKEKIRLSLKVTAGDALKVTWVHSYCLGIG
ncbi:hypothetical protein E2C01_102161 [Portunus trituberculatus]|uniref:Uncharacterized protein n=1 Tax=Portunus trituberculatus TaxID=210409 RepID=A0A5B7KHM9_PORTR|nr:hypothetical protein [Portunus trituberculatus]